MFDHEKDIRILTDDINFKPILDLQKYTDTVVRIIKGSDPKFSIGIYGEWGTGKTTLMRLVESSLRDNMFRWDDVPGQDEDIIIKFLSETIGLQWTQHKKGLQIEKSNDKNTLNVTSSDGKNSLSFSLYKGKETKAVLEIDGRSHKYQYDTDGGKDYLNVYLKKFEENNILTVWFNAWRYEREEHYALIALMKTIAYAMGQHPIYKEIKPIVIRGFGIFTKGILHKLATQYLITEKEVEEFEKYLTPKMQLLAEVDKETIYFDGLEKIERDV
jgi:hypothetical protein